MFNIAKPKNKPPQYKVIVVPTKTHQVPTTIPTQSCLEYAPKGSILVGQGENEKCKFVELCGNAKIDENGNFIRIQLFDDQEIGMKLIWGNQMIQFSKV